MEAGFYFLVAGLSLGSVIVGFARHRLVLVVLGSMLLVLSLANAGILLDPP